MTASAHAFPMTLVPDQSAEIGVDRDNFESRQRPDEWRFVAITADGHVFFGDRHVELLP